MEFGAFFLQVNMHRLTTSDFRFDVTHSRWRPWRHFMQRSAASWCSENLASVRRPCSNLSQFLTYSTFVHVVLGCTQYIRCWYYTSTQTAIMALSIVGEKESGEWQWGIWAGDAGLEDLLSWRWRRGADGLVRVRLTEGTHFVRSEGPNS